jgi:DNA invertase Pin-like site-specific DNA recombinase
VRRDTVARVESETPSAGERELLTLARGVASPDPLVALEALGELRRRLDGFERQQIRRALLSGDSYAAVARARGISRQAAHRQYRHLVDEQ